VEDFEKFTWKKFFSMDKDVAWVPFSDYDPAWIQAALVALHRSFTERSKYYIAPNLERPLDYVYPLPKLKTRNLRVAIMGDIGTNDQIHKNTLLGVKEQNPDLVIHLGDIYICGTNEQCDAFWNIYLNTFGKNPDRRPPLWSIPGNHEYINAGEGYFNRLVNAKKLGYSNNYQKSSYFSLESADYKLQILGVDTGYNSKNFTMPLGSETMDYTTSLNPDEAAWAQNRLQNAKDSGWRSIVLTHHQYFSAYWKLMDKNHVLGDQILKVEQPISAWLWGHEHRIDVYEGTDGLVKFAACCGHAAMPTFSYEPNPGSPDHVNATYTPQAEKVYPNQEKIYNGGFAMLEVSPQDVNSTDVQPMKMSFFEVDRETGTTTQKGSIMNL